MSAEIEELQSSSSRDLLALQWGRAPMSAEMLIQASKTLLHGKFVTWDDDDIVVSSLNWTSAAADPDQPWNDLGVHLHAPGIAKDVLDRLQTFFPVQLASAKSTLSAVTIPAKGDAA